MHQLEHSSQEYNEKREELSTISRKQKTISTHPLESREAPHVKSTRENTFPMQLKQVEASGSCYHKARRKSFPLAESGAEWHDINIIAVICIAEWGFGNLMLRNIGKLKSREAVTRGTYWKSNRLASVFPFNRFEGSISYTFDATLMLPRSFFTGLRLNMTWIRAVLRVEVEESRRKELLSLSISSFPSTASAISFDVNHEVHTTIAEGNRDDAGQFVLNLNKFMSVGNLWINLGELSEVGSHSFGWKHLRSIDLTLKLRAFLSL